MAKWDGKIPHCPRTGEMQNYPEGAWVGPSPSEGEGGRYVREPIWKDNVVWDDTLKFDGFSRGRSSALACFTTSDGRSVDMFLTDLSDAMKHMVAGCLMGRFTYCKRGANFAVKMLPPAALERAAGAQQQIHAGDRR